MAIFTLVTFVFSCNKDDDPIEQEIQKCPLFSSITYNYLSAGEKTYIATYVNENLVELKSNEDKVTFTYDPNGYLIEKEMTDNETSEILSRDTFVPDTDGQIIEHRRWRIIDNNLTYLGKRVYDYDGNKLMQISRYSKDDDDVLLHTGTFEWTGENPTKFYPNTEDFFSFNYDLTKENTFPEKYKYISFLNVYDDAPSFYHYLGQNMMTQFQVTRYHNSNPPGFPGIPEKYRYTYGENGEVEQVFRTDGNNPERLMWTYNYICP